MFLNCRRFPETKEKKYEEELAEDITAQEAEERRKLRLKMNQSNLMEFEMEVL